VKDEKMMGSLSGIATLRREGDVMVKEEENHKVITSEFNVGPLQLEVSKMYGKGQARTKVCNNWAQNRSCRFGDSCRFAHE